MCVSDEEHDRVALWNIHSVGAQSLQLSLLLLQILEVRGDALAQVTGFKGVVTAFIFDNCATSHDVRLVGVLLGVDVGLGFRILATHF